jgi:ABC-type polysaccharide/polyol phosphate export permease
MALSVGGPLSLEKDGLLLVWVGTDPPPELLMLIMILLLMVVLVLDLTLKLLSTFYYNFRELGNFT